MKKIFSLLMVAAIVLTMSLTSFAADPVSGMKQIITETDDAITVTVKVGNVTNFSGCTAIIITDKITSDGNYTLGSACEGWTVTPTVDKAGYVKYVAVTTDTSKYITTAEDVEVLSYTVSKTGELSAADFSIATTGLQISKITCTASGFYSSKNPTSKLVADAFTVEYVDARTPIVEEDEWEAGEDVVADAFKADLDAKIDYVRAVAIFGKNAAGTEYTVKFGANEYAGTAVVGQPWAMVLYDNGEAGHELISSETASYAYTVTAGEATWSGTAAVFAK